MVKSVRDRGKEIILKKTAAEDYGLLHEAPYLRKVLHDDDELY